MKDSGNKVGILPSSHFHGLRLNSIGFSRGLFIHLPRNKCCRIRLSSCIGCFSYSVSHKPKLTDPFFRVYLKSNNKGLNSTVGSHVLTKAICRKASILNLRPGTELEDKRTQEVWTLGSENPWELVPSHQDDDYNKKGRGWRRVQTYMKTLVSH